jgi:hypothetical protein
MDCLKGLPPAQRKEECDRRKRVRAAIPILKRRLNVYRREPNARRFASVKEAFASLLRAHVNAPFD